eukprot:1461433-Rhodomonas_salina.1
MSHCIGWSVADKLPVPMISANHWHHDEEEHRHSGRQHSEAPESVTPLKASPSDHAVTAAFSEELCLVTRL